MVVSSAGGQSSQTLNNKKAINGRYLREMGMGVQDRSGCKGEQEVHGVRWRVINPLALGDRDRTNRHRLYRHIKEKVSERTSVTVSFERQVITARSMKFPGTTHLVVPAGFLEHRPFGSHRQKRLAGRSLIDQFCQKSTVGR